MAKTVANFLDCSRGARIAAVMSLGDGCEAAIWENHEDRIRYDVPCNHTFSHYLSGGTGTRRLDTGGTRGWPGATSVMPAGCSSDWEMTQPLRFVHLYMSDDRLRSMYTQIHDCDCRGLDIREQTFVSQPEIGKPLEELAHSALSADILRAETAISNLIGTLPGKPVLLRGGLTPKTLRKVDEYIEVNLSETIHLDDLALLSDMSGYHFHRMFRLVRGCTPHHWVQMKRIAQAKCLLHTDMPIVDVALKCGFSSQSHLTRIFSKQVGQPPSQYRKICRAG